MPFPFRKPVPAERLKTYGGFGEDPPGPESLEPGRIATSCEPGFEEELIDGIEEREAVESDEGSRLGRWYRSAIGVRLCFDWRVGRSWLTAEGSGGRGKGRWIPLRAGSEEDVEGEDESIMR